MNTFNELEFFQVCEKLGSQPHMEDITINYINGSYFNLVKKSIEGDRRGEVVFCVIRPNGKIITITCSEYPEGVYRIPTGGVGYEEDIVKAVFREVKEELGLDVEILKFYGVLKIRFQYRSDFVMFYSYIFILRETGGRLLVDASDNEVSEVKEVDIAQLGFIANSLNNIQGKWSDWGKFRYVTSKAVYDYLKSLSDV